MTSTGYHALLQETCLPEMIIRNYSYKLITFHFVNGANEITIPFYRCLVRAKSAKEPSVYEV